MSEDVTSEDFIKKSDDTENPRESVFGEIPSDWSSSDLDDPELFSVTSSGLEPFDGEKTYVPTGEVEGGQIIGDDGTVSYDDRPSRANLAVREGDVLFAKMKDSKKVVRATQDHSENYMFSTGFIRVTTTNSFNADFLKQILLSNRFNKAKNSLATGSTQLGINLSDLSVLSVPVPPIDEQRKIASVLFTVDQAIQKTKEIIEQTERVRAGTSQDLFCSGISKGKSKDTWLGKIPEDWEVVQFSDIVESNLNGIYKSKDAYGEGYPIAKMGNALQKRTLDMASADRLKLTDKEKRKYGLNEGDLIFARRAQEVSAAGDCCYVPQLDESTVFESSLIRVRLSDGAKPQFYAQYFDSPIGSRSIKRIVTETTISGIATSDLLKLKVAVPSPTEQIEIASIMWEFDEKRKALQREKKRYGRLKRALMQDLLSGTVRTTGTVIEVPEESAQYG